jgi:ectoine hydroxylase-related dioxygenase (phytanoyl-CoA dioxygenase family)
MLPRGGSEPPERVTTGTTPGRLGSLGEVPDVADHLAAIERDGFTIVHDVFDAATAEALVGELERLERDLGVVPSDNSFEGSRTVRVYNLLAHGPLFERIPVDPAVLPVVEGVLDAGCLVSSLSSVAIGPDEVAQPIHADDQVIPLGRPHEPTVCNTMWALTDFTEANGATRIIPGSHTRDHAPEYGTHYDSIPAEMPRGSVLVWHGSLWHGGGANRTEARRYGIAMNYCAGWVRQQENQQLGLPLETVRGFEPRLRELCGFGTYRRLIGHIDKRTPASVLFGQPGAESLFDAT